MKTSEITSSVGQYVVNALAHHQSGRFTSDLQRRLFQRLRQMLIKRGDPLIRYQVKNIPLIIPVSHSLPITLARLPDYSFNIARIAGHIQEKYPALTVIDIGANVGDTAAILRSQGHFPILCIEGEDRFFALLETNAAPLKDVSLCHAFVGFTSERIHGYVTAAKGTASVTLDDRSKQSIGLRTLPDILEEFPAFKEAKLVKIDTDGFDIPILMANLPLWQSIKPILFFEYSAPSFTTDQSDYLKVFTCLRESGYQAVLVYEETGEYAFSIDLEHTQPLEDLFRFYSGRKDKRYCDLAVFHSEDSDLCDLIRGAELDYFVKRRGNKG